MENFLDLLVFVLVHLFSMLVLSVTFFVIGRKLTSRVGFANVWEEIGISCTVGIGTTATLLFGLGLIHQLNRTTTLCVLAILHLVSLDVWSTALRRLCGSRAKPKPGHRIIGSIFAVLLAAPMLLLTYYPPTQFDATLYHLPTAVAFVDAGSLPFLGSLRYPVFPQLQEMLFVLGFFLTGEIAAQMTQHVALVLVAVNLIAWGKNLSAGRAGVWSAALWLGNPLAVWLGGAAYVDIGLSLFVTAAIFAWYRWLMTDLASWLVLAAALVGFACASKYLGLFFLGVLGVATLIVSIQRRNPWAAVLFAGVVVATAGPWYARIIYFTGNPVFPFFTNLFGTSAWSQYSAATVASQESSAAAYWVLQITEIVVQFRFLLMVPFNAVFAREVFFRQAPISPWYLLLIPLLAYPALSTRFGRWTCGLVVTYCLFWVTTVRDIRFLLPIFPVAGLALVLGADIFVRRFTSRASLRPAIHLVLISALVAPGWLYGCYKAFQLGVPPTTPTERARFLSRNVSGHEAIDVLNRAHGQDYGVYGLSAENLRYYANGRFTGDVFGPNSFAKISPLLQDPQRLCARLRSMDVEYLLIVWRGQPPKMVVRDKMASSFKVIADTRTGLVLECRQ